MKDKQKRVRARTHQSHTHSLTHSLVRREKEKAEKYKHRNTRAKQNKYCIYEIKREEEEKYNNIYENRIYGTSSDHTHTRIPIYHGIIPSVYMFPMTVCVCLYVVAAACVEKGTSTLNTEHRMRTNE